MSTIILRNAEGQDVHEQQIDGQPNIILAHGVYYQRTGLHGQAHLLLRGNAAQAAGQHEADAARNRGHEAFDDK